MNIEELIQAAAKAQNLPESMVRRSAEARAKTEERSVEEILAEWAGVDPSTVSAAAAGSGETDSPTEAAPAPAAASSIGAEDLEAKAAEATGMSETMVRRSAAARAKAEGTTVEAVLAEWAGVDPSTVSAAPAAAAPKAPPAPAPAAAPAAAGTSPDELLAAAAEAQGLPEGMVKRSAAARAKAEGTTVEAVLAEWAGVDPSTVAAAPAAEAAPSASAPAAPGAEPEAVQVEVVAKADEAPAEPDEEPEPETVLGALPRWLAALFIVVPIFAIGYAAFLPNGPNCGDAGRLAVDPVTGLAVNCDGSAYGQDEVDFFAAGAEIFAGRCAVCHGPDGAGIANFPAFTDGALLQTFPESTCESHVEWVALGTTGWPDPTYGATNKPVGGLGVAMPGFATQLTDEEIRSVVLYERVQFGGLSVDAAQADCGL